MDNKNTLTEKKTEWWKLLLKIAVSVACLWYVFTKINFLEAWQLLKTANPGWLLAAFITYSLSKYFGARRLNINFKNIGVHLSQSQNVKLYWLGMFYNLFLPGAISGDAYKVVLLSKRFQKSYKKTTAAVLLDRFSGLLSLGLIVAFFSAQVLKENWLVILFIAGAILAIPFLYIIIKKFFPDFVPGFWPTFFWGALVQLLVLACVYMLLRSLGLNEQTAIYVFIFLIAALASVLPISIGGGLGVREFVIIEGAKYAGLDAIGQHNALVLSLLFYFITVACSLFGLIYVATDPFKKQMNING